MKRICRCGCEQPFEPLTNKQKNIIGHKKKQARNAEYRAEQDRRTAASAARQAYTEATRAAAEQASAERSPLTCPHRAVGACHHPRWGGMGRECITQRARQLCPLGFGVAVG